MKPSSLAAALAVVCSAALAAPQYGSGSADTSSNGSRSAAASTDTQSAPQGEGLLEKAKNALHRMGDKIRSATRKTTDKDSASASRDSDTRSMGAASSDKDAAAARQRRMDDAYVNSKSKQK